MEVANYSTTPPQPERGTDASSGRSRELHAIRLGILAAEANNREIDDGTAGRIASQVHSGRACALFELASSGAVDEERIYQEIEDEMGRQRDTAVRDWLAWLGTYCVRRDDKGAVDGWFRPKRTEAADTG